MLSYVTMDRPSARVEVTKKNERKEQLKKALEDAFYNLKTEFPETEITLFDGLNPWDSFTQDFSDLYIELH